MEIWKKLKRIIRMLAGKDLPKSVTKEPEPRYLYKNEPPDIHIEEGIIQRMREEWLPQPTTKRKTRDKSHRPPAAEHDIGELMKGKGGRHSRYYHKTIKKSPQLKIEEEEN